MSAPMKTRSGESKGMPQPLLLGTPPPTNFAPSSFCPTQVAEKAERQTICGCWNVPGIVLLKRAGDLETTCLPVCAAKE